MKIIGTHSYGRQPSQPHRWLWALVVGLVSIYINPSLAQDDVSPGSSKPALLEPPQPLEVEVAPWPSGAQPMKGGLMVDGMPLAQCGDGFDCLTGSRNGSGCSSCGGFSCRGGTHCVPGRPNCDPYQANTMLGRIIGATHDTICCPDPCYEPKWTLLANSAYFVDGARPVTQTKLRLDSGIHMRTPDLATHFWTRADGNGLGPTPRSPFRGEPRINYNQVTMVTEAAHGKLSIISEMPYRSQNALETPVGSGFGDIAFGTKTLLSDSALFQLALQFRTTIPTGNFRKGLGIGHVSMEPSLILGAQVSPESFLQAQIAQWIPIGDVSGYAGNILHYHVSFNHTLFKPAVDMDVIGTMEFNGYSFLGGSYSDPILGQTSAQGLHYFSAGPGIRIGYCDKLDFGIGSAFGFQRTRWEAALFRTELRFRF